VTSTPKLLWQDFDLRGNIISKLKEKTGRDYSIPIETDVNGCAYLEYSNYGGHGYLLLINIT
jgi:hypothetical protein